MYWGRGWWSGDIAKSLVMVKMIVRELIPLAFVSHLRAHPLLVPWDHVHEREPAVVLGHDECVRTYTVGGEGAMAMVGK